MEHPDTQQLNREQLIEFLRGGFAPTVVLLKEFDHNKAAHILDGLHFLAWILLGHMRARQQTLLKFIKEPEGQQEVWEDALWPENHQPRSQAEWHAAIDTFSAELEELISLVAHPATPLYELRPNGRSISWAAMAVFHHNAYHIGQLKTIGRQLGVW